MTRVKRGTTSRQKHNTVLSRTKGFRMTRRRNIKVAHEADLHAGAYAYAGRKRRKRDMRSLWILRIGEAAKIQGLSYSTFMHTLKEKQILLNRKILALLIREHSDVFSKIVEEAKK